jgi:hypothetical protein
MLSLARPLVVLDVETTGPDPATARVVEVALVTLRPDGQRAPAWSRRVNPQCHIPPEASAVQPSSRSPSPRWLCQTTQRWPCAIASSRERSRATVCGVSAISGTSTMALLPCSTARAIARM